MLNKTFTLKCLCFPNSLYIKSISEKSRVPNVNTSNIIAGSTSRAKDAIDEEDATSTLVSDQESERHIDYTSDEGASSRGGVIPERATGNTKSTPKLPEFKIRPPSSASDVVKKAQLNQESDSTKTNSLIKRLESKLRGQGNMIRDIQTEEGKLASAEDVSSVNFNNIHNLVEGQEQTARDFDYIKNHIMALSSTVNEIKAIVSKIQDKGNIDDEEDYTVQLNKKIVNDKFLLTSAIIRPGFKPAHKVTLCT